MAKKSRAGASEEKVQIINDSCDSLISKLSLELNLSQFQIAKQIHYRIQRSKVYRINPTKPEKQASLKKHKVCYFCSEEIAEGSREFHHLRRDVSNPHNPDNMVPVHKGDCHNSLHSKD